DFHVTGVQTCALPISRTRLSWAAGAAGQKNASYVDFQSAALPALRSQSLRAAVAPARRPRAQRRRAATARQATPGRRRGRSRQAGRSAARPGLSRPRARIRPLRDPATDRALLALSAAGASPDLAAADR